MNLKNKIKWTKKMKYTATPIIFAIKIVQDLTLISGIGSCSKLLRGHSEEQEFLGFFA